jgi:hypothetical protein
MEEYEQLKRMSELGRRIDTILTIKNEQHTSFPMKEVNLSHESLWYLGGFGIRQGHDIFSCQKVLSTINCDVTMFLL